MRTVEQTLSEQTRNPFAGFIIDDQGSEVPITEQMILRACQELESSANDSEQQPSTLAND